MRLAFACCLILSACGDDGTTHVPPQPGSHVIFIDIDDHGLSALWDSNSPNLQRLAKEGVFAYSRVDIPTHSNQSNMTLLTGAWPEMTDVPHNSWLDRAVNYEQPFSLLALSAGSYIYYDKNPLGSRIESLYTAVHTAGMKSTYVGLLPPFEHGADEVHFTVYQSTLLGLLTITKAVADSILQQLHYPMDQVGTTIKYDGPPQKDEKLNTFTLRDAAVLFDKAAAGGPPPPQFMFVWDFIALDDDPTSTDGADGPAVKTIVEDIDKGLGALLTSVHNAGYDDRMNFVITLDHGKVNTNNQVAFEKQLGDLVTSKGAQYNVGAMDWKSLNEDGDVLVYAVVPGAGTAAGNAAQLAKTHNLVDMIHDAAAAGMFQGLDISRTITWDGYRGTRRFMDVRSTGPNNPDIIMFPLPDWTLNDVAKNMTPGPIGRANPYGRHGGFSVDELYVPAIFYGPAFKKGVLLPEPIDHPDVTVTVAAALGIDPPRTAQGGLVQAAMANDMSGVETLMFPADPHTSRPTVLQTTGYDGSAPHLTTPAQGAILVDATGLYEDALMPGANLSALIQQGAHFTHFRNKFRDQPVNEYQILTGTYPSGNTWVPFAEDDPNQMAAPGLGQFLSPPAANFVSDMAGKTAWAGNTKYTDNSIFDVAKQMGLTTVTMGSATSLQHVDAGSVDMIDPAMTLDQILGAHARSFVYIVAAGDGDAELGMVKSALQTANVSDRYIVALVSRGAAAIDAAGADAHGVGSARHVPFVIAGPNIRHALIGMPATPLDVAPTILFALGATAQTPDLAFGVQLDGGPGQDSQRLPLPTGDRAGKVLLPAFNH